MVAIATMLLTFGSSILFFVKDGRMQLALALFGLTMAIWLYRIPSRNMNDTGVEFNEKEERS